VEKGLGGQEKSRRAIWVLYLIITKLYIEEVVEGDEN
jgi:hypothetical protein